MVTSFVINDNTAKEFRDAFKEFYGDKNYGKMKTELETMFKSRTEWFKRQIEKRKNNASNS